MTDADAPTDQDDSLGRIWRRRRVLRAVAAAGVTGVAGCNFGESPGTESASSTPAPTGTPTAADTPTDRPTETVTEEETATEDEVGIPSGQVWPGFQYDAANTGSFPDGVGPRERPEAGWTLWTGVATVNAADADAVYVGTVNGDLYAFDAATGDRRWMQALGQPIRRAPTVTGEAVYATGKDLFALAPDDGAVRWTHEVETGSVRPPAVADGTLFVGTGAGRQVLALGTDGTVTWRSDRPTPVNGVPAVADGRLFVGGGRFDEHLYAIDAATGDELWRADTGGPVGFRTPAVTGGVVFVGNDVGKAVAVDAASGELRWATQLRSSVVTSSTLADGRLYLGTWNGYVYALDTDDGGRRWRGQTGGRVLRARPRVSEGTVYVGSDGEQVLALDAATGEERWQHDVDGVIRSAPVPVGDRLHAVTWNGDVIALDRGSGDVVWTGRVRGAPVRSSAVIGAETVYVGGADTKGYAVDLATGASRWTVATEGSVNATPCIAGETVYICGAKVNAVDRRDGTVRWRTRILGPIRSSPTVKGEHLYIGGTTGHVYALGRANGEIRWETAVDGPVVAAPAVTDARVVVATQSGAVEVVDRASGTRRWTTRTGGPILAAPTVASGTVFVTTVAGTLLAVALDEGTVRWRRPLGRTVQAAPAVDGDRVFVPGDRFRAVDARDGSVDWAAAIPTGRSDPVVTGDRVYVGGTDGMLYVLAAADGSVVERFDVGGPVVSSPAVASGRVVVGGGDGTVYQFADGRVSED